MAQIVNMEAMKLAKLNAAALKATKRTEETRYISCADTAKLVRAALKAAFPGVKFSVTSSTYSGGASIDVRWVDGPTAKEVDAIAKRFEGATFDGMIDLKEYHSSKLNGERVRFGADYVMSQREISYELLCECANRIAAEYGVSAPEVKQSSYTHRGKTHTHSWIVRDGQPLDRYADGSVANYASTAGDKALELAYQTSKYEK